MVLEWVKKKFEITYETSAANSYILLRMTEGIELKQYQLEMMSNNSISGFLKMDIRQKNEEVKLCYNITSHISLSKYLDKNRLSKLVFLNIIEGIINNIIGSRSYLLSEKSILLHEDYIYINPSSLQTYLVYIPCDIDVDFSDGLKDLIVRLIVNKANLEEVKNDNYLQSILNFLRNEKINALDFTKLINELKRPYSEKGYEGVPTKKSTIVDKQGEKEQSQGKIKSEANKKLFSNNIPDIKSISKIREEVGKPKDSLFTNMEFIPNKVINNKQPASINIPTLKDSSINKGKYTVNKDTQREECENIVTTEKQKFNPLLAISLVQVLVIITFVLVSDYVKEVTGDFISAYGGTGLLLFVVDFLAVRKLLEKVNDENTNGNIGELANVKEDFKKIKSNIINMPGTSKGKLIDMSKKEFISNSNEIPAKNMTTCSQVHNTAIPQPLDSEICCTSETTVLSNKVANDTMILTKVYPLLKFVEGEKENLIKVSKDNFFIGRMQGKVDYISNNGAVGKIHAEIISRDYGYFIKDLNSKNFTYINGKRINPNLEVEIHNNDKITLADWEIEFIIPEG